MVGGLWDVGVGGGVTGAWLRARATEQVPKSLKLQINFAEKLR